MVGFQPRSGLQIASADGARKARAVLARGRLPGLVVAVGSADGSGWIRSTSVKLVRRDGEAMRDESELAVRAMQPATLSARHRRWRRQVVILDALVIAAVVVLGAGRLLWASEDAGDFTVLMAYTLIGAPMLLASVLTSDRVLADWLTPEDRRAGRAYILNPMAALNADRTAWLIWWSVLLPLWVLGGGAIGGVGGAFAGLLLGALILASCLLFGLLLAWLVVVPLGLLIGVVVGRGHGVQAVRLTMIALLILDVVVFSVSAAVLNAPLSRVHSGTAVLKDMLEMVLGLPGHERAPVVALWMARASLVVLLIIVPALVRLLRALPQQEAAGRLLRRRGL